MDATVACVRISLDLTNGLRRHCYQNPISNLDTVVAVKPEMCQRNGSSKNPEHDTNMVKLGDCFPHYRTMVFQNMEPDQSARVLKVDSLGGELTSLKRENIWLQKQRRFPA